MRVVRVVFMFLVIGFAAVFINEILRTQDVKVEKAIKLSEICPGIVTIKSETPLFSKGLTVTCSYSNIIKKTPVKQKKWSA